MWQTRREFLKAGAAGGATVLVSRLLPLGAVSEDAGAATLSPPSSWSASPGRARYRIDGLAKVTGQKVYARDFDPVDMPGWPAACRHALVLCAPFVDRIFEGIDLDALPPEGRPRVVVTAEDLVRDEIGIATEDYPAGKYLVKRGTRPDYYGKPVAILLFDDRRAFDQARKILVYRGKGVRAGAQVEVPAPTDYPETRLLHVMGRGTLQAERAPDAETREWVERVSELLTMEEWAVYSRTYRTPVQDPMFMEPEGGLAWFDRKTKTLELLVGTQSPAYDVASVREILSPSTLGVDDIHLYAASPGGAFGGRDKSILCLYLGIAAAYSDKPICIRHDRFQQFQQGVKRHASKIALEIAVDDEGRFRAIRNDTLLNGGGRINVSKYVGDTAGILGAGPYAFDGADIWVRPRHSRSIVAGSMRGFGAMQATFAVESLVDEIARERRVDPIDLRMQNLCDRDQPIVTGVPAAPPGMKEMLERAKAHPLWAERDRRHASAESTDRAFGVGCALAVKNYGVGADAVNAAVSLERDGTIRLTTSAVDMGQGLATALAVATGDSLGKNADEIDLGEVDAFDALELVGGLRIEADDPRWTPIVQNSTRASSGSSRWVHAAEQASRVLFETGLLPAARRIWGRGAAGLGAEQVRWSGGVLAADGFTPIPLAEIARAMHDERRAVAAMVHAFFSAKWISADYTVDGITRRWTIDGLAVRRGDDAAWERIDRRKPDLFTVESMYHRSGQTLGAAAAVVAVEVNRKTGVPRVVQGIHLAAPGRLIVPALVEGQMEGSWAMGVGHALLEELPAYEDGGSIGTWNLNRYQVALAGDCAIAATEKVILPPESPDAPARGMGEVALNCVPPAVANAIAHATGRHFRELPITAEKIRAGWS